MKVNDMFPDDHEIEAKYNSKSAAYYCGLLNGVYTAVIIALLSGALFIMAAQIPSV